MYGSWRLYRILYSTLPVSILHHLTISPSHHISPLDVVPKQAEREARERAEKARSSARYQIGQRGARGRGTGKTPTHTKIYQSSVMSSPIEWSDNYSVVPPLHRLILVLV